LAGVKSAGILEKIRQRVLTGDYEFALPHFFEEMANDNLIFANNWSHLPIERKWQGALHYNV